MLLYEQIILNTKVSDMGFEDFKKGISPPTKFSVYMKYDEIETLEIDVKMDTGAQRSTIK